MALLSSRRFLWRSHASNTPPSLARGIYSQVVGDVLRTKFEKETVKIGKSWSGSFSHRPYIQAELFMVDQAESVLAAASMMQTYNVGSLVVRDSFRRCIVGILTERDFLRRVAMPDLDLDLSVEQVMTSGIRGIGVDQTVEQCFEALTDVGCRHLPIFDPPLLPSSIHTLFEKGAVIRGAPESALVGVLSIRDLAANIAPPSDQFAALDILVHKESLRPGLAPGRGMYTMHETQSVREFVEKCNKWDFTCQLILDSTDTAVGFFTEGDLVRHVLAFRRGYDTPLSEVMCAVNKVPSVLSTATLDTVLGAGRELTGWKYLLVFQPDGTVRGIVTVRDVLRLYAGMGYFVSGK